MSTMKGNIMIIAPKKEQRPCPKPKKLPKQEEEEEVRHSVYNNDKPGFYYKGRYYGPPLRLIPYFPWRKAWIEPDPRKNDPYYTRYMRIKTKEEEDEKKEKDDDVAEEDEKTPKLDGKTKSLIKRLNKSPNSVSSKERTQCRNKSRQMAQAKHINFAVA